MVHIEANFLHFAIIYKRLFIGICWLTKNEYFIVCPGGARIEGDVVGGLIRSFFKEIILMRFPYSIYSNQYDISIFRYEHFFFTLLHPFSNSITVLLPLLPYCRLRKIK